MDWRAVDCFSDEEVAQDPYEYFDALRSEHPVLPLPHLGVVAVSGYDEAHEVYRDTDSFSSCNALVGPFAPFPVPLEGDDITDLIAQHRHHMPLWEHMVTMDPPEHTRERALLMRLLTPGRLKENEDFMWRLADQQLDEMLAGGECEFIAAYAQPFAMLVVADLLGVPEEHHGHLREGFGLSTGPGRVGKGLDHEPGVNPLAWLDDWFARYIEDRRANPRDDVLTQLARATYPDGSIPDIAEVVRTSTFLFAAGQETTARLLAAAMRFLGEYPEVQAQLRADKGVIPAFLEEVLRLESPVKTDFRLTKRNTTVAGVDIAAGTPLMMLNGAANRDPRRFECPHEMRIDRPNAQAHIAFGRGVHSCPGGPLARAEGRISLERILDRTSDIRLSETHHGRPGERRFEYSPTWLLRGDWRNVDYSLLGDDHVRAYQETGGQVGYWWNGVPTLLLTSVGRRSGHSRTTPLIFGRDGEDYLVVASVGGMPNHPAWYLNLQAEPSASVQVLDERVSVLVRTATDEERPRLWSIMNELWPNYDTYQSRTERVIPVVVLTPVTATVD